MPEPLRIEFRGPLSWMAPNDESSVLCSQVTKKAGPNFSGGQMGTPEAVR